MARLNWDEYFILIAEGISSRATCPRAYVGAILVKDRRILATGYNGSLPGQDHCIDVGCILNEEGRNCRRVIHAEANVLHQAARFGISCEGAVMYFWDSRKRSSPCSLCMPAIISAGIIAVVNRDLEYAEVTQWVP